MNRVHITGRLLLGASPEFRAALGADPPVRRVDGPAQWAAVEAARHFIAVAVSGDSEWHIARGIEAIGYADWLFRKATQIAAGPPVKDATHE